MGIKNFSKAFSHTRTVKPKDMKSQTIAIDVMHKLYQAALGANSVRTLTDASGKPTMHINVILANIIEFHRNHVGQVWVFDHHNVDDSEFHNPAKLQELLKRRKRREEAKLQIDTLTLDHFKKDTIIDEFNDADDVNASVSTSIANETTTKPNTSESDIDLDEIDEERKVSATSKVVSKTTTSKVASTTTTLESLEKRTWRPDEEMIHDIKIILNFLNIKYVDSPAGYEGEAIATYLNVNGLVDAVYSGDTDPIAYGVKTLYRVNPRDKTIYEYTQADIIRQIAEANDDIDSPDISHIRKAAIILGTDFCDKTPKIGPKTVLKKMPDIRLTKQQKDAMKEFSKMDDVELKIDIKNVDKTPFDGDFAPLIDWLVNVKSFNRSRMVKLFEKAMNPVAKSKPSAKSKSSTKSKPSAKSAKSKPSAKSAITKKPKLRFELSDDDLVEDSE